MSNIKNTSGLRPTGYRVLIKPEDKGDLEKKASKIIIPENVKNREQVQQDVGRLVDYGPVAWKNPDFGGTPWAEIGDRVLYPKYGGREFIGTDGAKYRIMNDEDIAAILEEELDMLQTEEE